MTPGRAFARPPLGNPSHYLLTNLARCGACGGPLEVLSRKSGQSRRHVYGCAAYHERGICGNRHNVPMADADGIVIEALLDDVLDPSMISDAIEEAVRLLRGDVPRDLLDRIDQQLGIIEQERSRLVNAIATGGQRSGLLDALREREARQGQLEAERAALVAQRRLSASEAGIVRNELTMIARSWRQVLVDDPVNARPIVVSLLKGRTTLTKLIEPHSWKVDGEGHLTGLFTREMSGVLPER